MCKSTKKAFSHSAPASERFLSYPYTLPPACQLTREKSQPWSYTKFTTVYVNEILKQHLVVWQKSDLYLMETWYFCRKQSIFTQIQGLPKPASCRHFPAFCYFLAGLQK